MFRRTDCHFALDRADIDASTEEYVHSKMALLEAAAGRVYLDTDHPRVCLRGPEDRDRTSDLGYAWLADGEVFPFFELRAAAVDLRGGGRFCKEETARRVRAQLDTLAAAGVRHVVLSAFGCGAFMNPAPRVAAVYAAELALRVADFDVVAFAIFHAGYGPNNFAPFQAVFDEWACANAPNRQGRQGQLQSTATSSSSAPGSPPSSVTAPPPPPRPQKPLKGRRRLPDIETSDPEE